MEGFYLLCAHLLGDYIFQTDWQASNKSNPHPGPEPFANQSWIGSMLPARAYPGPWSLDEDPLDKLRFQAAIDVWNEAEAKRVSPELIANRLWSANHQAWWVGNFACTLHCLLYTLAIWLFSFWWMPLWGLAACFIIHYCLDRYRLARKWMTLVGQEKFATGVLSPWSVVVVDNTFHLLTLAAIAILSRSIVTGI